MNAITGIGSNDFTEGYPRIENADFSMHFTMCDMAKRIAADQNYERKLKKIAENNKKYRKNGSK